MFVFDSHCKSLQSQTFRPVHPPSGALGSRSQTQKVIAEMLTVKRVDYTQKMVWHFLDPWSMHRWSVHKAWLVLRCQLNIGIFGIFATLVISFRYTSMPADSRVTVRSHCFTESIVSTSSPSYLWFQYFKHVNFYTCSQNYNYPSFSQVMFFLDICC